MNYAFISKWASYFLGRHCAGKWLLHAWGNHRLVQRTKFNFQPYAGGENNFPLLECWVDQRVMIQVQDTTVFWA